MSYYAAMYSSGPEEEEGASAFQRAEVLDLLAVAVALVLLVLALTGLAGGGRTLFAFAFAFFVPGRAIVSNWRWLADWADIGMSVALSIATLTVTALVALWLRFWHPLGLFQLEAALSLLGLGAAIARRRGISLGGAIARRFGISGGIGGGIIGGRPRSRLGGRPLAEADEQQQG